MALIRKILDSCRQIFVPRKGKEPDASDGDASAPEHKEKEDTLESILSKLERLCLPQRVITKGAEEVAHGAYCDVFDGHVSSEHLRHRRILSTKDGQVKIAIKTLRIILKKDVMFAKVRSR